MRQVIAGNYPSWFDPDKQVHQSHFCASHRFPGHLLLVARTSVVNSAKGDLGSEGFTLRGMNGIRVLLEGERVMSFFARVAHVIAPKRSTKGTYIRRPQNWTRPKTQDMKPVLDNLEFRQTVSDSFFVSLHVAGVSLLGNIAAEKARDPFGLTNTEGI